MNNEQQIPQKIREIYHKSRNWAILRCSEIMMDCGRKDLARQILFTTRIDLQRLKELKSQVQKDFYKKDK